MTIVRGRGFQADEANPVVVVNETLARRYFAGENPIGRRIRPGGADNPWYTIVGVVADVRFSGAREPARAETFIPYWQYAGRGMNLVLAGPNAAQFAPALRVSVAAIDPALPLVGVRTMEEILRNSLAQPRFVAMVAGAFAALALLLAAVGLYSVMAYTVSQRTTEIGVRVALGSTMADVFQMVVGDGLRMALVGTLVGVAGAVVVGRSIRALLYDVEPTDAGTLIVTAGALLAVATAASLVPAWRASRVDPIVALRAE